MLFSGKEKWNSKRNDDEIGYSVAVYNCSGFDWFWLMKTGNKSENENLVYVCPECGDHHCNCYLEEKEK